MPELVTRRADLAFGVLEMLASLALFVMLWGVLNMFVPDLFGSVGLEAQGAELSTTQTWIETAWSALPFIALVIVALRFITRSAFESRGGV
jgi:hypothetical protein